jgi:predicted glycosyltransferase involved in capsule biosynthesis
MKISLCSTCMNRLEYLKLSFPTTLKSIKRFNKAHLNSSFDIMLCNYDSKDDLDYYVNNNLKEYLDLNILKYIKIENKQYYVSTHAKNIAHKYATGDIVINLDCDNIIRYEVLQNIYEIFKYTEDINKICLYDEVYNGLIGISKYNFIKLGGYNEEITTYSYDDREFGHRIDKFLKCKRVTIDPKYDFYKTCVIEHEYHKRNENFIPTFNHKEDVFENLRDSNNFNVNICNFYLEKNISNPNEYNNIEYGKI